MTACVYMCNDNWNKHMYINVLLRRDKHHLKYKVHVDNTCRYMYVYVECVGRQLCGVCG